MKVLVVAKTRMRGYVCVGGHELETFQSLRLMTSDGKNMPLDTPLEIGEVWDLEYAPSTNITPPHVEDVLVNRGKPAGSIEDLARYLTDRATPWRGGGAELFDGHLKTTRSRRAFVPVDGPMPSRSTGYWLPDAPLRRQVDESRIRYRCAEGSHFDDVAYVGVADGPDLVRVGDLVRVSLSRRLPTSAGDNGYWLQISGFFPRD